MNYVIGIDGGGTKTQVVLVDLNGKVLLNTTYGSTNPNAVTKQELNDTFQAIFQEMEENIPGSLEMVSSIFAGVSGAGSKASASLLTEIIAPFFSLNTKITVVPDSINALYSGTFGMPGIVQISGTGSITYGINERQEQGRVGGWGYLLGDEGSGYDVGKHGIQAVLKFLDGRGPETMLKNMLFKLYTISSGRELIDKIYYSDNPRLEISRISKLVFQAFEKEDTVAMTILRQVAHDIAQSIMTLDQKLFNKTEKVTVVLCGGLFSNPTILPVLLRDALINYPKRMSLIIPEFPPVVGSVVGAYLAIDCAVTEDVKLNLRSSFINYK
ncbi:N-acetylglucosamine kinase [Ornithinibacillus halotolerans]|uniref:N-acetylmuramic acid/N-acetylglucosamine kinase n=1 Tax=Ornithinibacillus halotolerans TaxID=1274357 RepID=A0A916RSC5_9BACI|nr:BadF/BadG/BcrA/BcrD ATPase family protein [Ornithinibacillus halotolerans]GGA66696.1 N-acetylmuramic acid/N-acetylglucosamine kinase [Ornithinibacillus halotolerans]